MDKVLKLQELECESMDKCELMDSSWVSGLSIRCKCGV